MDWWQVATIAGSTMSVAWFAHMQNVKMWRENAKETKDFHGRMCTLEERYIQMLQRFVEKKEK